MNDAEVLHTDETSNGVKSFSRTNYHVVREAPGTQMKNFNYEIIEN